MENARRRVALTLVAFSVLLAVSTIAAPIKAADYSKVGVKQGEIIEYAFDSLVQGNRPESAHISIDEIAGSHIEYSIEVRYLSGTEIGGEGADCDISLSYNIWMHFLVSPRLEVGDRVYIDSNAYVNDTSTMNVAFVNRLVNHVLYPMDPIDGGGYADLYYDVETGLLVRYYFVSEVLAVGMALTYTSAFSCGISLVVVTAVIVDSVALVAIICVGVIRRRVNAGRRQR